jgi:uncharacterized CHY-type Zn-finger protein
VSKESLNANETWTTESENTFVQITMSIVAILCFLIIFVSGNDLYENIESKHIKYLVHLLVSCFVGVFVGGLIALLGILLWRFLGWIIQNILMITIILLSIFLFLALSAAVVYRNQEKTKWIITSFITAVIIGILIMVKLDVLPIIEFGNMTGGVTIFILATAVFLILLVVTLIKSLSDDDYHDRQKWWFIGALSSTIVIGFLVAITIEKFFPDSQEFIESISSTYIFLCFLGSPIGILFFPVQLGRAFYKIFEGRDVIITHTHKPLKQHEYENVGYQCGKCFNSISSPESTCPHCGVRFSGLDTQYLGAHPKPTTTKSRNTTPFAGFSTLALLLLNMLYGVSLFQIRQQLIFSSTISHIYILGGAAVNLIIIAIAVFLTKRYAKLHGGIQRVSYY